MPNLPDKSLLGVDLNLVNPPDARTKIAMACAKCWFEKNPNGVYNYSDCSGFVKAVQKELYLRPFDGDANSIFDEVGRRTDWQVLGEGSAAAPTAGNAAEQGNFVIGVWKNPKAGHSGHVAIVTAYIPLLGEKPEQRTIAAWGQLHKIGSLLGRMSESFGKPKHSGIKYAKSLVPILF